MSASRSGQPMSATQIAKAIEYLPDRTQAALERIEHAGQVVRNEGGRWAIGLSAVPHTAELAAAGGVDSRQIPCAA
jgi:DNA-binding IclR family transcriptional regulator